MFFTGPSLFDEFFDVGRRERDPKPVSISIWVLVQLYQSETTDGVVDMSQYFLWNVELRQAPQLVYNFLTRHSRARGIPERQLREIR